MAAGDPPAAALEVMNKPLYKPARWGLLVSDRKTGQVLYAVQADKLFEPASTTKLFTCAAAMDLLGAAHRFQTPVYVRGQVDKKGALTGDLILVGSGDQTLGGRTLPNGRVAFCDTDHTYDQLPGTALTKPDPLAGLNDLARHVAAAGIKRVNGDVLVDQRLFDMGPGTEASRESNSALMVSDNVVDVVFTPTKPGQAAKVSWRPAGAALMVDAQVITGPAGSQPDGVLSSPAPGKIVARGSVPADGTPIVKVHPVADPGDWARSLFIEALGRAGVEVTASALAKNDPCRLPPRSAYAQLKKVASYTSPPLSETIRLILKTSHNLGANQLPLVMAANQGMRTMDEGMAVEGRVLQKMGVPISQIALSDGEGGVRSDRVTPRAAVKLLSIMAGRQDFPAYYDALPIIGVDGSLHGAVGADSPVKGKVRAKTGSTIAGDSLNQRGFFLTKALAGYMTAQSGRELIFALYVNGFFVSGMEEIMSVGRDMGSICLAIYQAN